MKKRKAIQVLSAFSGTDWKKFRQLIVSPWFGASDSVQALVAALDPHFPEFPAEAVDRRHIFGHVFPGKAYNDQDFRLVVSDLNKFIEEFLIQQELKSESSRRKQLLLRGLESRGLDKLFLQQVNAFRKELAGRNHRDLGYYSYQEIVEEEHYSYHSTRKSRKAENNLQALIDVMDTQFLYKRLKYSCEMLNLQNILSVDYEQEFLEALMAYLDAHPQEQAPAIRIYRQILLTLRDKDNETHYRDLKSLLADNLDNFSTVELKDMYAFAQNYCIRHINLGSVHYLRELFGIYQLLLQHEIITEGDSITQFDYKNIVTVALRLDELSWAETFMEDYKPYLGPSFRENAYNYNWSRLLFFKHDFRGALRYLLQVEYTDVFYELDSRSQLLKIYYELEEYEPFLSLVASFRVFLRRNKEISAFQRTIYVNQINFAKKLFTVKMGGRKPVKVIKEALEADPEVADQTWLRQKIAELEPPA